MSYQIVAILTDGADTDAWTGGTITHSAALTRSTDLDVAIVA
jgi:hypothetical protein